MIDDINSLKELRVASFNKKSNINDYLHGFIPSDNTDNISLLGYQLTGAQLFIKNLFNPNTLYKRLLINWQTGVGKSIAAISIGNEFIKFFQEQYIIKRKAQYVCILGFNTTETIRADMLKFPELGYVTEHEIKELNKLLIDNDPKHVQYMAMLQRRISDSSSGGYYKFYGYREFANSLFIITDKGLSNKIVLQDVDDTLMNEYLSKKYIIVNIELLNSLKNGIIICDEIHNVYNSLEVNNYGFAIRYVLNNLGEDAPRAVFMSATPLTGNASEIIDLLTLLIPNAKLNRNDYFYKDDDGIYQLKDNTLDTVTELTVGKVSFLIDTDTDLYPTRIFDGTSIQDIPYIKIIKCELSEFHNNTIKQEENLTHAQQVRSLFDIAFPNPNTDEYGLYNSSDIVSQLKGASNEWKNIVGIDIYHDENVNIITGSFLYKDNLRKYSIKYYTMLIDVLSRITEQGKIMVFHYNVQISGIVLLQEIFKMNGFIDEISEPNNSTLCVICGRTLSDHNENISNNNKMHNHDNKMHNHAFKPCRFIVAHSNVNKLTLKRNMAKFNDINNLYGTEIKLILGSRIIQEGLNFKAIRYQYIMSLPINFPILIQVLGRVVRKNSHINLPEDQRNVHIRIYAHDIELPRYIRKAKEYKIIQEVERAFRINAVDNFVNKITFKKDTLESLAFEPDNITLPPISTKNFDAYYYDTEILLLSKILRLLFNVRPVWTYNDIVDGIKHINNINYDIKLINEDNIELAIHKMNVYHIGDYYISTDHLDIECYFRKKTSTSMIDFNISQYYSKSSASRLFNTIMATYEDNYINNQIELSLVELPSIFHIEMLKRIVIGQITDNNIINLYKRFKILIIDDKSISSSKSIIGYIDNVAINLYNFDDKVWYNKPYDTYNIGKRYEENKYFIGYTSTDSEDIKFKIREPIGQKHNDLRTIRKGVACENHARENMMDMITLLRKINSSVNSYAYKYDHSIVRGSNANLCSIIKLYMLFYEEESRSSVNGMKSGIRWVYLFHDNLPNIMIK